MTFVQFVVLGPDENYGLDDVDGVVDEVVGLMFEYEYDLKNLMMLMMLVGWMMLMEALSLSRQSIICQPPPWRDAKSNFQEIQTQRREK